MNRFVTKAQLCLSLLFVVLFASCSGEKTAQTTNPTATAATANGGETAMMNVRYINKESLLNEYFLAKDLSEAVRRSTANLENIQRMKAAEIQKFAASIETKYKNNGYLSEASFNADQQKLQKMQVDAQNYLQNLERNVQEEIIQNNIQLNDSVNNFIKEYNAEKGYEAIFDQAASVYFNEKYDITVEVIEGLNARYNKVNKK